MSRRCEEEWRVKELCKDKREPMRKARMTEDSSFFDVRGAALDRKQALDRKLQLHPTRSCEQLHFDVHHQVSNWKIIYLDKNNEQNEHFDPLDPSQPNASSGEQE